MNAQQHTVSQQTQCLAAQTLMAMVGQIQLTLTRRTPPNGLIQTMIHLETIVLVLMATNAQM